MGETFGLINTFAMDSIRLMCLMMIETLCKSSGSVKFSPSSRTLFLGSREYAKRDVEMRANCAGDVINHIGKERVRYCEGRRGIFWRQLSIRVRFNFSLKLWNNFSFCLTIDWDKLTSFCVALEEGVAIKFVSINGSAYRSRRTSVMWICETEALSCLSRSHM